MKFQSIIAALSGLTITLASPIVEQPERRAVVSGGNATFYGGNIGGGHCSFTTMGRIPNGMFGTAFSGQVWNHGGMCGSCLKVTRGSKSITVMVVDECPECDQKHLDLFKDGFLKLGTEAEGIIPISYEVVNCGIASPLKLVNKVGTTRWWFSMQVVNANGAVKSLEVSTNGGKTWQPTTRRDYNFFEKNTGFGTEKVSVRVTGATGKSVITHNVGVGSQTQFTAAGNI
ncbi:related to extracellular cellulase CelA/allergen Asp F7-like, putative [Rhynchosporium secalis]|uniref:Related to extracellular cellulase CelA/allergen Asp F7-like, putative n=1 Tax=Rhynchosporium secalis TaxID=38038 RepID=A0A1E1MPU4_RHYSE|nr:related to extracellular cellulase CelA/allergen Asp F7-like, putative [Rhynchosporium secalis]